MSATPFAQCLAGLHSAASEVQTQQQTDRASQCFRDYIVAIDWPALTAEQRLQALAPLLAHAPLTAPVRHALGISTGSRIMRSMTLRYELPPSVLHVWEFLATDQDAHDTLHLAAQDKASGSASERARLSRQRLSASKRQNPEQLQWLRLMYLERAAQEASEAGKVVRVFSQLCEQRQQIRPEILEKIPRALAGLAQDARDLVEAQQWVAAKLQLQKTVVGYHCLLERLGEHPQLMAGALPWLTALKSNVELLSTYIPEWPAPHLQALPKPPHAGGGTTQLPQTLGPAATDVGTSKPATVPLTPPSSPTPSPSNPERLGCEDCWVDVSTHKRVTQMANIPAALTTALEGARKALRRNSQAHRPLPHILLHGPAASGKTFLAQAIAAELGFLLFAPKPEMLSQWVNGSASNLSKLLEEVQAYALQRGQYAIVFFDEIDALLATTPNSSAEDVKVVRAMLKLLDGIDADRLPRVAIMGATSLGR